MAGDAEANPIIGIWSTTSRKSVRIQNPDGSSHSERQVRPGLAPGHAAGERGRDPGGAEGLLQLLQADPGPAALPLVQDPELPHLLNAVYGLDIPDSDPNTAGIQRADLIACS